MLGKSSRRLVLISPCQIFQTDNGGEFASKRDKVIKLFALKRRRIHARRKNENAYIESFHRSLRKECLGWIKYQPEEREQLQILINNYLYLVWYNTQRPHLGLDLKTPVGVKKSHLQ